MKFGLNDTLIQNIEQVFRNYPEVEQVIIYGSRAKGNFREGSDIDIILLGAKLTNEILSKVRLDLDELNTPYLFDVSLLKNLTAKSLIEHIERVGQVLYTKEN